MRLRTVADDNPSLDILEIVRDPTGSPVVMCVLISSASISRLRSSISDPLLIISTLSTPAYLARWVGNVHYAALGLFAPQSTIASEIVSRRHFRILLNQRKHRTIGVFTPCLALILQGPGDCTKILNLETRFLSVPVHASISE